MDIRFHCCRHLPDVGLIMHILNIGLERDNKPNLTGWQVVRELRQHGIDVTQWREVPAGKSEPTAIVAAPHTTWQQVFEVAQALDQDAIADYNADLLSGALIGPQSAKWGTFNPAYFQL